MSTQLKNSYLRVILPFEHLSQSYRSSPPFPNAINGDGKEILSVKIQISALNGPDGSNTLSGPASPLSISSSPLSEPPDDSDILSTDLLNEATKPRRSVRNGVSNHAFSQFPFSGWSWYILPQLFLKIRVVYVPR